MCTSMLQKFKLLRIETTAIHFIFNRFFLNVLSIFNSKMVGFKRQIM